jgi:hypothetical protein
MLTHNGFCRVISDGVLHLFVHEEEPSVVVFVFPEPCGALNSYFGVGSLSWDCRLQIPMIVSVITILSNRKFGRDDSHSAIVAVYINGF